MIHLGDIKTLHGHNIPPVDTIIGGSPCQDLSVAGNRKGLSGDRSGLFMDQLRIVKEMRGEDERNGRTDINIRPRYMVWENVPGALSSNKGEDFRVVLEETVRIKDKTAVIPEPPKGRWSNSGAIVGDGWSIAWRVHDAQFWGVPQRRRRIALVADFGGYTAPEILFERKGVSGDTAESGGSRQRAAATTQSSTAVAGATGFTGQSGSISYAPELSPTLIAGQIGNCLCLAGNMVDRNTTQNGSGVSNNLAYTLTAADRHAVCCAGFPGNSSCGAGSIGYQDEIAPTLRAAQEMHVYENHAQDSRITGPLTVAPTVSQKYGTGGNNVPLVMDTGQAGAEILADCSPTLTCNHEQPIVAGLDIRNGRENGDICGTLQAKTNGGQSLNYTHPVRIGNTVRRLTPLECERLQGYPDGWTDVEWSEIKQLKKGPKTVHKKATDSQRYKALGNSIALPFWRWMLRRMSAYLPQGATLGSLFDGIGGFPLIWQEIHGPGTAVWASEIDSFAAEVTKLRFFEEA